MTRVFVVAAGVAVVGLFVIQFYFDGWPTLFVAMAGAVVGVAVAAPAWQWSVKTAVDWSRRQAIEVWLAEDPARFGELVAASFGDLIVTGQPTDAGFVDRVKMAETMAVSLRSLAVHGREKLYAADREAELRKAL